ncbi:MULTISPECIES: hypothetical protein [Streptomyces]|uniref:Secreted protein n=1 Tax=Streptomyces albus (strain ATCC 21838 / DSM 41398 / FERM P-419 / JCM 4703 / NBRC 107858) TaxID=1081613 RepID=A0A0B5EH23_STRA4|nr:hypothetical protein [Streptomyces sp. SCSIO ZS0520]AJE80699.1 hypothetical protein SLNWT_0323 [Streptomyces albus]AOU75010.1 hypothetical protein SLNHY_0319 [Streptomyces albus]AYN30818.1 hypothetical protein DUI70_0315 [Streptomyces albus]
MRTAPLVRTGLALVAAALPLTAAGAAQAAPEFTVTAQGDSVHLRTGACAQGGLAKLVATGRANPVQGRTATLKAGGERRTASWSELDAGVYTVSVLCRDGSSPGARTVRVPGSALSVSAPNAAPTTTPTISATSAPPPSPRPTVSASPSRGVQGGLGGSRDDYSTLVLAGGGALVAAAAGGTLWQLRRLSRRRPS